MTLFLEYGLLSDENKQIKSIFIEKWEDSIKRAFTNSPKKNKTQNEIKYKFEQEAIKRVDAMIYDLIILTHQDDEYSVDIGMDYAIKHLAWQIYSNEQD